MNIIIMKFENVEEYKKAILKLRQENKELENEIKLLEIIINKLELELKNKNGDLNINILKFIKVINEFNDFKEICENK